MRTERHKYTYFLSTDGGLNYTQFYPDRGIKLSDQPQSNEIFYRKFCDEDITISRNRRNDAGTYINKTLFDTMASWFYDRTKLTTEIKLTVYNNYTGSAVEKWKGYFTIAGCELDMDGGKISFLPQPDDDYRYLVKYLETEVDITDLGLTSHTVTISALSQEEICYSIEPEVGCSDDGGDWMYCGDIINILTHPEIYAQYGLDPEQTYRVNKRQRVTFEPQNSTGWYEVDNYWYKASCTQETVELYIYGFYYMWELVEGIIDYLRDKYDEIPAYSFRSQFLLSSITGGATNYITGLVNYLQYLMISQKSNVRLINPTNLANKALMSLNDLFGIYKAMFDAWWYIDADGYVRIEHRKYFDWGLSFTSDSGTPDIDLTDDTYYNAIYQRNIQKYGYPSIAYNAEEWNYMESSNTSFRKEDTTIEYDYVLDKRTPMVHNLSRVTADIQFILDQPDKIADDGFVVAYCDPSLRVTEEPRVNSSAPNLVLNGHLCIPNLIYRYHRYSRLSLFAEVDGDEVTFLSEKKTRRSPTIVFTINESDVDGIDPYKRKRVEWIKANYTVTTQDGQIEKCIHDLEDDIVEMVLLFDNGAADDETFRIMINDSDAVLINATDTLIYQP